eukprot:4970881-Pyramimonas_sp.AAC.1
MSLERQLKFMGALARRRATDMARQSVFDPERLSFQPREPAGQRRRGRPRTSWAMAFSSTRLQLPAMKRGSTHC